MGGRRIDGQVGNGIALALTHPHAPSLTRPARAYLDNLPGAAFQPAAEFCGPGVRNAIRAERGSYREHLQETLVAAPPPPGNLIRRAPSQGGNHIAVADWEGSQLRCRRAGLLHIVTHKSAPGLDTERST